MTSIEPAIVEFANEALYLAFNNRDLEQMDQLWSDLAPCVCIHPGRKPLHGKEEIMASWRDIFAAQNRAEQIACHSPRISVFSELCLVTCYEQLSAGWLIATNCFTLEEGRMRIFYHHAGQCMEPPDFEIESPILQ